MYSKVALKTYLFKQSKWYRCLRAIPDRSKAYLYGVIMTSLQGVINWSHERFMYFLIKKIKP